MEVPNPKRQKREGDRENDHLANAEDKIDLKTAQKDEEFFLNSAGNVEIASSVQKIQNMFLRRIVKENHGTTILQCAFYSRQLGDFKGTDGMGCNSSNLVATVCASQLNIYDNQHCGDHLDLISQFTTSDIRCSEIPNPEFTCFSWIYSDDDDALVAVAGSHSIVHIISLSRSEELCRLRGHRGSVVDLQCHQIERRLLMSLCKEDSSIRGWDTSSAECIYLLDVSATAMCFNSEGSRLLVAQTVESTTQIIQIPFVRAKDSGKEGSPRLAHCIVTGEDCPCIQSYRRVDHMRYVSGNVLVKSPLGLELLHTESNKVSMYRAVDS
ncbi:hypothetical protein BJ742DRAFT_826793 [Cladochytrium replicatum]|nr:hypothetical protein BJ742DRAFT_826793 [Cladochytrium replicatum]